MVCRIADMRDKEVINLKDGSRLGFVYDVEFDTVSGNITAVILLGKARFFGLFGKADDLVVKWSDIEVIGDDTILVCAEPSMASPKKKNGGFLKSLWN